MPGGGEYGGTGKTGKANETGGAGNRDRDDGVHHVVGAKYLQDYINAYAFRWNHRNDDKPMFLQILSRLPSLRAL